MGGFQINFEKIRKNEPLYTSRSAFFFVGDGSSGSRVATKYICAGLSLFFGHARIGRHSSLFVTSTSPPSPESTTLAPTRSGCLEHNFGLGVTWLRQVHRMA